MCWAFTKESYLPKNPFTRLFSEDWGYKKQNRRWIWQKKKGKRIILDRQQLSTMCEQTKNWCRSGAGLVAPWRDISANRIEAMAAMRWNWANANAKFYSLQLNLNSMGQNNSSRYLLMSEVFFLLLTQNDQWQNEDNNQFTNTIVNLAIEVSAWMLHSHYQLIKISFLQKSWRILKVFQDI